MRLAVKNWKELRHYKDRNAPWIKLQKSLLDDYDFHCLPVISRAIAPLLWLMADEDGTFDGDYKRIAFRLRMTEDEVVAAVKPLFDAGYIGDYDASVVIAERKQADSKQDTQEMFEEFWKAYPRKIARQNAEKAFTKANPSPELFALIMDGLERAVGSLAWKKDDGAYIPHAATWLNGRRWEDVHVAKPMSPHHNIPKPGHGGWGIGTPAPEIDQSAIDQMAF